MVLPTLFVGIQAIRTNALEGGTLEALGQRLAHSRTYAEVEDAMFNQTQVVWRYLSGDPDRKSTRLNSSHGYISYAVFCLKKKNSLLSVRPLCQERSFDVLVGWQWPTPGMQIQSVLMTAFGKSLLGSYGV